MPRVKLEEMLHYPFHCQVAVRVSDLNYGGHLGNDALVSLLHEARVQLLAGLGCRELDLGDGQTGLIMADLAVNFKEEAFMADLLEIDSAVAEVTRKSFRVFHRVSRAGRLIALAETGLIAFNYARRETAPLPAQFLQALERYR